MDEEMRTFKKLLKTLFFVSSKKQLLIPCVMAMQQKFGLNVPVITLLIFSPCIIMVKVRHTSNQVMALHK